MSSNKKSATRIATLKERVAEAERERSPTFDVPFRGHRRHLHRIRIETTFPLYRIQSGRTHRAKSQYLEGHPDLPKTFFADPEDPKVQKAQHEILLGMINERDLSADLQDRKQLSPLVLTSDGYVVDGNRRLAALRNQAEGYADAVVLPADAQSHEIYETEIELQMQRETKAPYNWIDQALHIEYGLRELEEPVSTVAKRMRKSEAEINNEIAKLHLVRSYLAWIKEDGKYHKVPQPAGGSMEQAFEEMAEGFRRKELKRRSPAEVRVVREACFAAIQREAGYMDIRRTIKQLGQYPDRVAEKLRQRSTSVAPSPDPAAPSSSVAPAPSAARTTSADPLRALVAEGQRRAQPDVTELLSAVNDPEKALLIAEVVEELEEEEKQSKRQQLPLQRIQRAIGELQQVELGEESEDLAEVAKALERLGKEVERVSSQISRLRSKR